MKYYVVSDVHGFYTQMRVALEEKGFFADTEPHKLIVCGDMLDRGNEVLEMQQFMCNLLDNDELIFIRGNHEDLMVCMLDDLKDYKWDIVSGESHHNLNGTWDSALSLAGMTTSEAFKNTDKFIAEIIKSPFYSKLLPASVDYFETDNYIFVHGWIPCSTDNMPSWYRKNRNYKFDPDWRDADKSAWNTARWFNGMEVAEIYNVKEPNKIIVCGHWHASYGHALFEKRGTEFMRGADFTPYFGQGVIGIDACTAHSGFVNCLVIEE